MLGDVISFLCDKLQVWSGKYSVLNQTIQIKMFKLHLDAWHRFFYKWLFFKKTRTFTNEASSQMIGRANKQKPQEILRLKKYSWKK